MKNNRCAAAAAKSLQSCLTLCNPIDGSPPTPMLRLKLFISLPVSTDDREAN